MKAQCKLCSDNALQAKNIVFFPYKFCLTLFQYFLFVFFFIMDIKHVHKISMCSLAITLQSCPILSYVYSPFIATNANVPLAFQNISNGNVKFVTVMTLMTGEQDQRIKWSVAHT